jgi:hypothetical protein
MAVIEISDHHAEALRARAAREGVTLEAWIARLAESREDGLGGSVGEASQFLLERIRSISERDSALAPEDGASEHDHYIHGWPKRGE